MLFAAPVTMCVFCTACCKRACLVAVTFTRTAWVTLPSLVPLTNAAAAAVALTTLVAAMVALLCTTAVCVTFAALVTVATAVADAFK